MNKKKVTKILTTCLMSLFVIGMAHITVHAETVYETEPNDSRETAELIEANKETPSGTIDGSRTGQFVVKGYSSTDDADWFKVYLDAGTNYFTCNDNPFNYTIEDESGNIILKDRYEKGGFGPTAFEFYTPSSGYYYIQIRGIISTQKSYIFLVGSPNYAVTKCEIPCREGKINMTSSGGTQTAHFDADVLSNLPEDAIAFSVALDGLRSSSVGTARLTNENSGTSFSLNYYTWSKDKLLSMNLPVKSTWTAKLGFKTVTSFTPVLRVNFVYPIYNTMVEEVY